LLACHCCQPFSQHFLLATYFLLAFLSYWGDRTALHPQSLDGLEVQKEMMLSFAFLYGTDFLGANSCAWAGRTSQPMVWLKTLRHRWCRRTSDSLSSAGVFWKAAQFLNWCLGCWQLATQHPQGPSDAAGRSLCTLEGKPFGIYDYITFHQLLFSMDWTIQYL
jgi:hypothetical protein